MKNFFNRVWGFFRSERFVSILSALLCGVIAVPALPPYGYIFTLFIAFSGLIILLDRAKSAKRAFALGYAFGFGFFSVGLAWVSNALLTEGMGFAALAPLPPIGFGIWGGFFPACVCLVAYKAKEGWRRIAVFAAAWGVSEWVRAWLFTGFPWNLIATVWTPYPEMLQTASVWGAYGLSAFTVFSVSLCSLLYRKNLPEKGSASWMPGVYSKTTACVLALIFGAFALFGVNRLKDNSLLPDDNIRGIKIRLVQPDIPQGQKWNKAQAEEMLMKHVHLSREKGAETLTHVIWPETATQFLLEQDEFARAMAINALKPGAVLITGGLRIEKDKAPLNPSFPFKLYNSILVFDDAGYLLAKYDKSHLVPFGEYAPLRSTLPFMKKFTPGAVDFSSGDGVKTVNMKRQLPVGMLVCYEVIFPAEVVDEDNRPYWLLNVTNDGWYGNSAGPYQHFAAAQMRAVEEGIPLVRAANTGISGVIDAYGVVRASLPLGTKGYLDTGLPRRTPNPTLYARFGNAIPLGLFAVVLLLAFFFPASSKKVSGENV